MKEKNYIFVSGLPRSGSTLLCNLLAQHPDVFATPTSGCHEILFSVRNNWFSWTEHRADKVASAPENLVRVMSAILHSYHNTDKSIICDKCRSWIHNIEMLEAALGRKAKILVPVRDVAECVASFEELFRRNAHLNNVPGIFLNNQTTEGRANQWTSMEGEIGIAYNRIQDALQRGYGDRLMFVEFDKLTNNPKETMTAIWKFLEIEEPIHNFNDVKQVTMEDDTIHGYIGMHDIGQIVKPIPHKADKVLGPKLSNIFKQLNFWKFIK